LKRRDVHGAGIVRADRSLVSDVLRVRTVVEVRVGAEEPARHQRGEKGLELLIEDTGAAADRTRAASSWPRGHRLAGIGCLRRGDLSALRKTILVQREEQHLETMSEEEFLPGSEGEILLELPRSRAVRKNLRRRRIARRRSIEDADMADIVALR